MRISVHRRWIAIAALFASPIVTVTAAPEWARETAMDLLAYPAAEKQIRELKAKREDYQQEIEHILRRCAIKEAILDDLETGRITLLGAADRFRVLDCNSRTVSAILYPPDRVGSFDEIAAITVIRHMQARFMTERPRFAGTVTRLEGEFETAYGYRPE